MGTQIKDMPDQRAQHPLLCTPCCQSVCVSGRQELDRQPRTTVSSCATWTGQSPRATSSSSTCTHEKHSVLVMPPLSHETRRLLALLCASSFYSHASPH